MLDYKDIITKHYALGMSGRKIAESLKVSKSGVNDFLQAFQECPVLSYPLPEGITNYGIAALVYGKRTVEHSRDLSYEMPDYESAVFFPLADGIFISNGFVSVFFGAEVDIFSVTDDIISVSRGAVLVAVVSAVVSADISEVTVVTTASVSAVSTIETSEKAVSVLVSVTFSVFETVCVSVSEV